MDGLVGIIPKQQVGDTVELGMSAKIYVESVLYISMFLE